MKTHRERGTNMTDHREDIDEAAGSYMSRDPLGDDVLEATVLTAPNGTYRVEFLLACGGPTVWVVSDSRNPGFVEFHHTWGKRTDPNGTDTNVEEMQVFGHLADRWQDAAELLTESQ
jgi:hypothetical protein